MLVSEAAFHYIDISGSAQTDFGHHHAAAPTANLDIDGTLLEPMRFGSPWQYMAYTTHCVLANNDLLRLRKTELLRRLQSSFTLRSYRTARFAQSHSKTRVK